MHKAGEHKKRRTYFGEKKALERGRERLFLFLKCYGCIDNMEAVNKQAPFFTSVTD